MGTISDGRYTNRLGCSRTLLIVLPSLLDGFELNSPIF